MAHWSWIYPMRSPLGLQCSQPSMHTQLHSVPIHHCDASMFPQAPPTHSQVSLLLLHTKKERSAILNLLNKLPLSTSKLLFFFLMKSLFPRPRLICSVLFFLTSFETKFHMLTILPCFPTLHFLLPLCPSLNSHWPQLKTEASFKKLSTKAYFIQVF